MAQNKGIRAVLGRRYHVGIASVPLVAMGNEITKCGVGVKAD